MPAELLQQIEAIKAEGHALCAGLTPAQFNWRPGPGRWSVAECLVHLNVSVTATFPAFDKAIDAGRAEGRTAAGPFRYGWFAEWMIRVQEPPVKRRMKTFPVFQVPPQERFGAAEVLPEFRRVRDALADRVRRSEGLDLRTLKVTSPASRWFRMPLGAYLRFVVAHDRRHLWQARQVRAAPGFGC